MALKCLSPPQSSPLNPTCISTHLLNIVTWASNRNPQLNTKAEFLISSHPPHTPTLTAPTTAATPLLRKSTYNFPVAGDEHFRIIPEPCPQSPENCPPAISAPPSRDNQNLATRHLCLLSPHLPGPSAASRCTACSSCLLTCSQPPRSQRSPLRTQLNHVTHCHPPHNETKRGIGGFK